MHAKLRAYTLPLVTTRPLNLCHVAHSMMAITARKHVSLRSRTQCNYTLEACSNDVPDGICAANDKCDYEPDLELLGDAITVSLPPGKLGVMFKSGITPPTVDYVKDGSAMAGLLESGDAVQSFSIVGGTTTDTVSMNAVEFVENLLARTFASTGRSLIVERLRPSDLVINSWSDIEAPRQVPRSDIEAAEPVLTPDIEAAEQAPSSTLPAETLSLGRRLSSLFSWDAAQIPRTSAPEAKPVLTRSSTAPDVRGQCLQGLFDTACVVAAAPSIDRFHGRR